MIDILVKNLLFFIISLLIDKNQYLYYTEVDINTQEDGREDVKALLSLFSNRRCESINQLVDIDKEEYGFDWNSLVCILKNEKKYEVDELTIISAVNYIRQEVNTI